MFDQFRAAKRERPAPTTSVPLSPATSVAFPGGYDPVAAACSVILDAAGETSWPLGKDEQKKVLRRARRNTHPDRNDGDLTEWDKVRDAAQMLRLA